MSSHYFNLEPEVAGSTLKEPRSGRGSPACLFDTWLGDDVVCAHPLVLVTTKAKRALVDLERATGFTFIRTRARTSPFYRKHNAGRRLPVFWEVIMSGRAGRDDMGLTAADVLVVSGRVLDALLELRIRRAVITQYVPAEPGKTDA